MTACPSGVGQDPDDGPGLFGWLADSRATVLVLHAHPDDEVYATGAAARYLAERGCRVVLRAASLGEAGEPRAGTVAAARKLRFRRFDRSCEILGITDRGAIETGRWTDTGGSPSPGSLTSATVEELAAVVPHVQNVAPRTVLTVGSDGLTEHPDHILMHQAVIRTVGGAVPVYGAVVQAADVVEGHRRLAGLLPGTSVGSGRMTGSTRTNLLTFRAPGFAPARKLAAMNQYAPLGRERLADAIRTHPGRGNLLLLRAVLDATGTDVERYEPPPNLCPTAKGNSEDTTAGPEQASAPRTEGPCHRGRRQHGARRGRRKLREPKRRQRYPAGRQPPEAFGVLPSSEAPLRPEPTQCNKST